jgi:hypothetical protein
VYANGAVTLNGSPLFSGFGNSDDNDVEDQLDHYVN